MKDIRSKKLRSLGQALVMLVVISAIVLYDLYTKELTDFRLLGIGDLNPYGGWSSLRELATDSSYVFEGISRSMALTIALIVLSIMGGRFFCGWICPLGAIQDFFSWLGERTGVTRYQRLRSKYINPVLLKYLVLLGILLVSTLGWGANLAGVSPWRALLSLPKAAALWDEMKAGFLILAVILLASVFLSRAFCRYLCPLGAVQALFASLSPVTLWHDKDCSNCSSCMKDCPVGIRLSAETDTISPECIRCMNCIGDCKAKKSRGIRFGTGSRTVPVIPYAATMLTVFLIIWLGVPLLWGGIAVGSSIPLGALKDGAYQGEARGFAGRIVTEVIVDGGKITEIEITKHQESKGWYEEVFMTVPRKIIEKQRLQVEGISGATKTSRGLVKSIENAIKKGAAVQ